MADDNRQFNVLHKSAGGRLLQCATAGAHTIYGLLNPDVGYSGDPLRLHKISPGDTITISLAPDPPKAEGEVPF